MTRDALVALLRGRDPLAAAAALTRDGDVTFARAGAPGADLLVDGDRELPIADHRSAHAEGRPSDAAVRYGEGVDVEHVAERLMSLAELARETGLLRAVCPIPAEGVRTPGSWGVEDLTVVAAARGVLDPSVRVRPSWTRLGAATCGVTLAFGADDLVVPEGDDTDVVALAAAAGRRAVPR
jgi:2-iminoacetate synthase ThiH